MEQHPALLLQLSFTSRAQVNLPPSVLARIEQQSRDFNEKHELTGELRHEDGVFFEVAEGPSSVILPLAARIFADTRHLGIVLHAMGPIPNRRFTTWEARGFGTRRRALRRARDMTENLAFLHPVPSRNTAGSMSRNESAKVFRF